MHNQYCKVGAATPITSGNQAIHVLEVMYKNFMEKAANATQAETDLAEFFKRKAQGFKKVLESLS